MLAVPEFACACNVRGKVIEPPPPPLLVEPPHEIMPVAAIASSSVNTSTRANREVLRKRFSAVKAARHAATPMPHTQAIVSGISPGRRLNPPGLRSAADPDGFTATLTLRVAEVLPFAGTLIGFELKLQFTPAGAPPQASAKDPETEFVELTDRLKLAEPPTLITADAGDTDTFTPLRLN